MELFSLKGKNAIVIGGSRGLGKGMAEGLALAGAQVILSSRDQNALDTAAEELSQKTGNRVIGIAANVTTKEGVEELVNKAEEAFGHVDILLNSAGINIRKPALEYTVEDWDQVQNVQLKAVFLACQAVGNHMVKKGIRGKIINVASVNSRVVAAQNIVSYVSAKGGVMQLTKALAVEWAQYGICVNAIAPGFFKTEMTKVLFEDPVKKQGMLNHIPMKRFGNPQDLAGLAIYFASDLSDYTTGQIMYVDGGWTSC